MEMKKILTDNCGEFTVSTAFRLLGAVLVLALLISIFHVYYVIGSVREKVNESVLAVAAANVAEFYGGARDVDGYATHTGPTGFTSTINTDDVVDTLARSVGATAIGSAGTIVVGDSYKLSNISTTYTNAAGSKLNFTTALTVEVYLKVGAFVVPITKSITVRSSYETKF